MSKILLLNPEEEPFKKKHISWKVKKDDHNNTITLYEVVECLYDHPQAPGEALIPRIEIDSIVTYNMNQEEASSLLIYNWSSVNLDVLTRTMKLIPKR